MKSQRFCQTIEGGFYFFCTMDGWIDIEMDIEGMNHLPAGRIGS